MQLKVYNTVFYSRLYYVELIMGYRKFRLHQRKNAERKRLVSRQIKSVQGRPKRRQRGVRRQTQVIPYVYYGTGN